MPVQRWQQFREFSEFSRQNVAVPAGILGDLLSARTIGSIRRDCVDHIVVLGEQHLRHVLLSYMSYYNETRIQN